MVKIGLLVAAGLAAGFVVSFRPEPVEACSCYWSHSWQLTLVEATEDDRHDWASEETSLTRNDPRNYTLNSGHSLQLDLEVK